MTRFATLAFVVIVAACGGTPTVVFTYNETTGAVVQTGNLIAGSSPLLVFRQVDGAWPSAGAYSLTIKPDGRYDVAPLVLATGAVFSPAGRDLSLEVDLNVAELYAYLGKADARTAMMELANASQAYFVRTRIVLHNSVRRPADSPPANPPVNTYTDAQIDAMIAGIPSGLAPVPSPVDGWLVDSTATGQLRIGPFASALAVQSIDQYPEATALSTSDYLLLYDSSEGALRKVELNSLVSWLSTQLGL